MSEKQIKQFDPLDESDVLEAERSIGGRPTPTGRIRLVKNENGFSILQEWRGPNGGIWLPAPVVEAQFYNFDDNQISVDRE